MMNIKDCEPDLLIRRSFDYYADKNTHHKWTDKDFEDCKQWMWNALNMSNGAYDVRKIKIIAPEQPFDFTLDYDWAHYKYDMPDGSVLEGQLSIKGTMDVVSEIRPGILQILDYKTGERKDWATGDEKTYEKLNNDHQLRLYSYACFKIFPDVKDIIITIIYCRDGNFKGGPFTVSLSRDNIPETERMIEKEFNEIRECTKPYLTPHPYWSGLPSKNQKVLPCTTFCNYGKILWPGTKQNICQFIHNQVKKHGIEDTTAKYGNMYKIDKYQGGAGRSPEDRDKSKKGTNNV